MTDQPPDPLPVTVPVPVEPTGEGWDAFYRKVVDRQADPGLACPYHGCVWRIRGRGEAAVAGYRVHARDSHATVTSALA